MSLSPPDWHPSKYTLPKQDDAQLEWRLSTIDQLDDRAIAKLLRILGTIGLNPSSRGDGADRRRLRLITKGLTQYLQTLDAIGDQLDE